MTKNTGLIVLLISAVMAVQAFIFTAPASATDDGEFQFWNTEGMSWKFAEGWKAGIEEEFRFGDDMRDFYYQHSDFGFTYSGLAKWLELGANYREVYEKKGTVWMQENRPHLTANFKFKLHDVDFSNRARFEYRDKEDADDYWRYRDKATAKFPVKVTRFEIQPYTADEIFYDFDKKELNENWLYGGLTFKIFKQLSGETYYMWQKKNSTGDWINVNVLGAKLKADF